MQHVEKPLFCFGTLMDTDLMNSVAGTEVQSSQKISAGLNGYRQRCVAGENFPVICVAENSIVEGVLFSGLSQLALERIRFYEGDEYQLMPVNVEDNEGNVIDSMVFFDSGIYSTTSESWNFEQWQKTEKPEFLIRVRNYMQYFGQMTTTEADKYW